MTYTGPSPYDCGADWNRKTIINEDGEEDDVCGCVYCERREREAARAEYLIDDYDMRKGL